MNQPIDLDNPSFTAFAAGELDGAELEAFQAMLGDASALKELSETEEMISLLTDCFEDEWKTDQAAVLKEQSITSYALGELDDIDLDEVETLIDESPIAAEELAAIEAMAGLLSESLEGEWRSQAPVDLDVPAFTNYALGELSGDEAAEFETILKYSSTAVKELGETEEFISLLSEGLEKEWKSELSATDHEFSLVEATGEENVVSVNFAQASRGPVRSHIIRGPVLISLAAVLAGLLVVGGMISRSDPGQNSVATAIVGFSSDDHVWFDVNDKSAEVSKAPIESFDLRLLEETNHSIDHFELADTGVPNMNIGVADQFGGSMVKASYQGNGYNRVDSYLPSGNVGSLPYSAQRSLILGCDSHSILASNHRLRVGGVGSVPFDGIFISHGCNFEMDCLSSLDGSDQPASELSEEMQKAEAELGAIISELDNPNVDMESVQRRLSDLLKLHKEIGLQMQPQ